MRSQEFLDRSPAVTSGIRRLRLPVTCIAVGISVLYCSERSVASLFASGSNTTTAFAVAEAFASTTLRTVWQSTVASVSGRSAQSRPDTGRSVTNSKSNGTTAKKASGISTGMGNNVVPARDSNAGTVSSGRNKLLGVSPLTAPVFSPSVFATTARPVINGTTTNATWNGGSGSSDNWNDTTNWVGGLQPQGNDGSTVIHFAGSTRTTPYNDYMVFTLASQILFDSGASSFVLNGNAIKLNFKIENNSANTQTYNMGGLSFTPSVNGGFVELDPTAGDLILNTPGSSIFLDNNAALEIFGSHVLRINAPIVNGIGSNGSFLIMGGATVIFNNANTYTGDTQVNAGDLRFTINGSIANSTIRLGGVGSNSPDATVSLGTTAGADTGLNLGNTLNVRPSSSGTQGTRLLRSLSPSGTNTYSGGIFLDTDLTVQASTGSTLLFDSASNSINVKNHVLTIDDNGGNVNTQGNVTIREVLGSSFGAGGSLVKNGGNTLILQNTSNTYTGTDQNNLNANGTQIGGGILGIYGDGSLGNTPNGHYNNIQFTGSATLQDTANNISLAATRDIRVASGATASFDSNGNTFTINGVINGSGGNIAKAGNGSVILTSANTFTGSTTINTGTLNVGATSALGSTSGITVNSGGTLLLSNSSTNDRINDSAPMTLNANGSPTVAFNTGGLSEHGVSNNTAGIGALTLQSSSIIDMGSGASIIAFANSSSQAVTWGAGKVISIYNWSGIPVFGGGTDQLYFGSDATGLVANQLLEFQFYTGAGTGAYAAGAIILADGEVVPVPEPGTWAAGALAMAALAYGQWRRLRPRRVVR